MDFTLRLKDFDVSRMNEFREIYRDNRAQNEDFLHILVTNVIFSNSTIEFKRAALQECLCGPEKLSARVPPALVAGFLRDLDYLKKANREQLLETDFVGNTLLHYAAAGESLDVLKMLPSQLYKQTNRLGETALIKAAKLNCFQSVLFLLSHEHGVVGGDGVTVLWHLLIESAHSDMQRECIQEAVQYQDELLHGLTKGMISAYLGDLRALCQLDIKRLQERDNFGRTMLFYAVQGGCKRVAKHLRVQLGGACNDYNQTALSQCVQDANTDIVKILAPVEAGLVDVTKTSSLMRLCEKQDNVKWRYLRVLEACLRDSYGRSANGILVEQHNCEYQKLLWVDKILDTVCVSRITERAGNICSEQREKQLFYLLENPIVAKETQMRLKQLSSVQIASESVYDEIESSEFSEQSTEYEKNQIPIHYDWFYRQVQHENAFNRFALREAAVLQDTLRKTSTPATARSERSIRIKLVLGRELRRQARTAIVTHLRRDLQ